MQFHSWFLSWRFATAKMFILTPLFIKWAKHSQKFVSMSHVLFSLILFHWIYTVREWVNKRLYFKFIMSKRGKYSRIEILLYVWTISKILIRWLSVFFCSWRHNINFAYFTASCPLTVTNHVYLREQLLLLYNNEWKLKAKNNSSFLFHYVRIARNLIAGT